MAPRKMVRGKTPGKAPPGGSDTVEIDQVIKDIKKRYGDLSIFNAVDRTYPQRLGTSVFTLDLALLGGIARGKISMFHGPRSSGKTTAALKVVAVEQRRIKASGSNERVAFVDAEHAMDTVWAEKLGVDLDTLLLVQPETGEQAVDIIDALMHTREITLVVVDSIAALVPMREVDASAEDVHVGIHAKLVTGLVRKVNAAFVTEYKRGHHPTLLCLNQNRSKIGGWSPTGDPLSLPGGKALEFFTGMQVKFANKENMSKDDEGFETLDNNEHSFRVDKNKYNAGIRAGEYAMMRRADSRSGLNEGDTDDAPTVLAFAKRMGVYTGGGRSWKLELIDETISFGSGDEAVDFLYANRDKYQELRQHLLALHASKLGMPQYVIDHIYGE